MASAEERLEPEVLSLGPRPFRGPSRRLLALVLVTALLIAAGSVAWWLRTRPTNDFGFTDLQDVYAGMVRADGTNDLAELNRDRPRPAADAVTPDACRPLFETTLADQFPVAALDGVSTYWLGGGSSSAVSLFTLRYADSQTAAREYQTVADALAACGGEQLTLGRNSARVAATPASYESGVRTQLGYLVTLSTGDRYAIAALQYANTITWQFRLEVGTQPYEPYVAQRLMDSFAAQLRSIEELRADR